MTDKAAVRNSSRHARDPRELCAQSAFHRGRQAMGRVAARFAWLLALTLTAVLAHADPRDDRERKEVVKIFDLLTSELDMRSGDGLSTDEDCVFKREWKESWRRNTKNGKEESFYPRALLSIQEALDPHGKHSEMFCDHPERDARLQKEARERGKIIVVSNFELSYPIFFSNLQRARIYYFRESRSFLPGDKKDIPPGSLGVIELRKRGAAWTYKITTTAIVN